MPFPSDPHDRSPKGDHNRRLALGMDINDFANAANLTPGEVHKYEMTDVDGKFDLEVANKVGVALERLEATVIPKVDNGGKPSEISAGEEPARSDGPRGTNAS